MNKLNAYIDILIITAKVDKRNTGLWAVGG